MSENTKPIGITATDVLQRLLEWAVKQIETEDRIRLDMWGKHDLRHDLTWVQARITAFEQVRQWACEEGGLMSARPDVDTVMDEIETRDNIIDGLCLRLHGSMARIETLRDLVEWKTKRIGALAAIAHSQSECIESLRSECLRHVAARPQAATQAPATAESLTS